jgi:uncharacterized protein involved in exopolysaccharide biosynthesis
MNDRTISDTLPISSAMHGTLDGGFRTALQAKTEDQTLDLVEYWRSIDKRKWSILGLVVLVALIATLVVFSLRPLYRATAVVMIEQNKAKVVSIEEVYNAMGGGNREYYQTQVEIIKSRELARKVVEKLKLTTHPEYDPRQAQSSDSLKLLNPVNWFKSSVPMTEERVTQLVINDFMGDLQVQPVRNSQLVKISFTAYDKELAAKVPNTLAETFIENDLESKIKMTQKASAWLVPPRRWKRLPAAW